MPLEEYLLFLFVCGVIALTPGPAVVLTLVNGMTYGLHKATIAIMGNLLGIILLSLLSTLGLGALLQASSDLFVVVKVMGGMYLIYLGLRLWYAKAKGYNFTNQQLKCYDDVTHGDRFRQAFFVTMTNPKAIVFLTALYPQFLHPDQPLMPQMMILIPTLCFCSFLALCGYAFLASRLRHFFQQARYMNRFNKVMAGFFVSMGAALALSHR
jgi:threonine/homoserine/homoserine lactone efflux protein